MFFFYLYSTSFQFSFQIVAECFQNGWTKFYTMRTMYDSKKDEHVNFQKSAALITGKPMNSKTHRHTFPFLEASKREYIKHFQRAQCISSGTLLHLVSFQSRVQFPAKSSLFRAPPTVSSFGVPLEVVKRARASPEVYVYSPQPSR